jgi:tight junction protein 3
VTTFGACSAILMLSVVLLPRAEQLASLEAAQRAVGMGPGSSSGSNARAEFWRLRGLRRGAKKSTQRSREDLSALTRQGRYPPYERVVLREGGPGGGGGP